jgi:DNA-binding NtrC family response regulator
MHDAEVLEPKHLQFDTLAPASGAPSAPAVQAGSPWQAVEAAERSAIVEQLRLNANNISATAKSMAISRVTLHRKLRKFKIDSNNIDTL